MTITAQECRTLADAIDEGAWEGFDLSDEATADLSRLAAIARQHAALLDVGVGKDYSFDDLLEDLRAASETY